MDLPFHNRLAFTGEVPAVSSHRVSPADKTIHVAVEAVSNESRVGLAPLRSITDTEYGPFHCFTAFPALPVFPF